MGIKVEECSTFFGNNNFLILNAQYPSSYIKKKNSVTSHKSREAVSAGYVRTRYIDRKNNPNNITTKSLGFMYK